MTINQKIRVSLSDDTPSRSFASFLDQYVTTRNNFTVINGLPSLHDEVNHIFRSIFVGQQQFKYIS